MFIGNQYDQKIREYEELLAHINKLAPRTGEGKLPKVWKTRVDELQDHIDKYKRNRS